MGAALPPPSLGGVALFPILLCGCCLLSLSSFFCWKVLPYLLFLWIVFSGGATFPLSSVGWCRLASFVGCCCVLPSPFAWCCLPSPPLGGAAFPLLFSWVVLLGLLRWVVLRCSLSFCVVLPSPPSLGGSLSKRKIKKIEKNEVKKEKLKSEFLNPIPDEKVHLSPPPPHHPPTRPHQTETDPTRPPPIPLVTPPDQPPDPHRILHQTPPDPLPDTGDRMTHNLAPLIQIVQCLPRVRDRTQTETAVQVL